jgi:hypothetical protein
VDLARFVVMLEGAGVPYEEGVSELATGEVVTDITVGEQVFVFNKNGDLLSSKSVDHPDTKLAAWFAGRRVQNIAGITQRTCRVHVKPASEVNCPECKHPITRHPLTVSYDQKPDEKCADCGCKNSYYNAMRIAGYEEVR